MNMPFGVGLTKESGIDSRNHGRNCRVVWKNFPNRQNEVGYQRYRKVVNVTVELQSPVHHEYDITAPHDNEAPRSLLRGAS
jgi:hypothetical protein